ncbi:MAG TPA: TRAP transporter TatT component family protein [Abditibacterium sp.]|jgi:hypothetical protein
MNFEILDDNWKLRGEIEVFESILQELETISTHAFPDDLLRFETEWRIGRAHHFAAMRALEHGDLSTAKWRFRKGHEAARWGWAHQPERVEGIFWESVCLLEAVRLQGKIPTLLTLGETRKNLNRALKDDETFHFAGSHRVLGRIFYLAPRFVGGDSRKSEAHFRRALEIADNSTTRLYFGEFLASQSRKGEAKTQFEAILAAQADEHWLWEQARDRILAQNWLEKTPSQ